MEDPYAQWASSLNGRGLPKPDSPQLDIRPFASPYGVAARGPSHPTPQVLPSGPPPTVGLDTTGGAPLSRPLSTDLSQAPTNMAGLYMHDGRGPQAGQQIPPFPAQFPLPVPLPPHMHGGGYHHAMPPMPMKPTWTGPPPPPEHMNPNVMNPTEQRGPSVTKCLTLAPPSARVPSYPIPLPNDCEGLIFALEGKFKMGDEIISDAASAILSVLTDKFDKVSSAYIEGLGKPKLKLQITKSLENSWITSSLLGEKLISVALQLKAQLEAVIAAERRLPGMAPNEVSVESLEKLSKRPYQVEAFVSVIESLEKWVGIRHCLGVLEKCKSGTTNKSGTSNNDEEASVAAAAPPRPIVMINPNPEPRGVGRPRARRVPSIGEFVDSLDPMSQIPMPKPPPRHDILGSLALALPGIIDLWSSSMLCGEIELQNMFASKSEKLQTSASASSSESISSSSSCAFTSSTQKRIEDTTRGGGVAVNMMGDSIYLNREVDLTEAKKAEKLFADSELMDLFLESVKEVEFLQWKEQRRQSQCEELTSSNQSSPIDALGGDASGGGHHPGVGADGGGDGHQNGGGSHKESTFLDRANLETLLHGEQVERTKHLARIEKELQWSVAKDIGLKYPFLVSMNRVMIAILKLASYLGPIDYKELISYLTQMTASTWESLRAIDIHSKTNNISDCPRVLKQIGTSYLEAVLHFAWEQGIIASEPSRDARFFAMSFQIAMYTIRSFARFVTISLFPSVATRTAKTFQYITSDNKGDYESIPIDLPLARAAILVILVGLDELTSISKLPEMTNIDLKSFVISLLYCTFGASVVYGRIKGYVSDTDAVHLAEKREEILSDSQTMRGLIDNLPAHLQDRVAALIKEKKPMLEILHTNDSSFSPELKSGTSVARRMSNDGVNASVVPGSYTIPLTQTPPERDLIDSTKERSTSYGADLYGPIFEDIIYTCSATLANVAHDPESRALLKESESILEEISVLSRSTQIAQLCRCIARNEPLTSIPTTDEDDGITM